MFGTVLAYVQSHAAGLSSVRREAGFWESVCTGRFLPLELSQRASSSKDSEFVGIYHIAAFGAMCVRPSVRPAAYLWPVLKRQQSQFPGQCIFWQSTLQYTRGFVRRPSEWRRSGEEMVLASVDVCRTQRQRGNGSELCGQSREQPLVLHLASAMINVATSQPKQTPIPMLLEAISNPHHCLVSPPPCSLVVALCAPFRVRFHNSCVVCSNGIVSTAEQASQLVFSAAIFRETLRMCPPVPMTFLHSTVRSASCVCPRGPTAFFRRCS